MIRNNGDCYAIRYRINGLKLDARKCINIYFKGNHQVNVNETLQSIPINKKVTEMNNEYKTGHIKLY